MRPFRIALLLASCAAAGAALAQKPPPLGAPAPSPPPSAPGGKPPPLGAPAPSPGTAQPAPSGAKPPPLGAPGAPPAPSGQALPGSKPPPLNVLPPGQRQAGPISPPGGSPPGGQGTKPPPAPPGPPGGEGRQVASGTGFIVAHGRLLTNRHVANGCNAMRARTSTGTELPAQVLATDEQRDLALLAVDGDPGPVLRFRSGPEVRRGEGVVTYGFPLAGLLSSGPTLTTGAISALSGLGDNQRQYQISAPVQPGNSGGPLLDMGGHVVGVVVSKLNAERVARATGDIPQNVNFAIKGTEATAFLQENHVEPQLAATEGQLLSAAEVGEIAHPSTVFLRCLR